MAKGRERTGKWYFRNENEVIKSLGLTPAIGSGNTWLDKEDGSNEHIIAQLKSTDKQSFNVKKLDIDKLEHNALIANKVPVFIIQFLKDDTRYAMMAIEDIPKINEYLNTGEISDSQKGISATWIDEVVEHPPKKRRKKPKIKSDAQAREEYNQMMEEERKSRKWRK